MRIFIQREQAESETRVAATPTTVKRFVEWGWDVTVEPGAGIRAGFPDELFADEGATMSSDASDADIVLRAGLTTPNEAEQYQSGTTVIGFFDPYVNADLMRACERAGLTVVALEAIPRTTLAQSMDALSSQATVGGYAAVLLAAQQSPKFLPMLVTAAGTIPPARVLILGVGVAGLQAIATARRLGALVHAYDVRPETREQVESLGAKFVEAPTTETDAAGYAQAVDDDVQARQFAALAPHVKEADLIITTAQIPGRPAPLLITDAMVATMKPGSVIVDMAAASGGNVEPSRPDETVTTHNVTILGPTNLASTVAADASNMLARNMLTVLERARDEDGSVAFAEDTEVLGPATVIVNGVAAHPRTRTLLGYPEEEST
ncbi:MAG: NAD(P) transhydrogenase subunit alpha [Actinobacteria bacterium]|nr:NAD(P) transhydrogenase subunit alpha [Actinomycetota bacterium]